MGAWGYEPMESDGALDWLGAEVVSPLLATIKNTLQARLDRTEWEDYTTPRAEAAAALLIDLTDSDAEKKNYSGFRCNSLTLVYFSKKENLWELAANTILEILNDEEYLAEWGYEQDKPNVLNQLLRDLQRINSRHRLVQ